MPLEREERHARDLRLVQAVLRGDEAARAEFATRMACAARILAARNRRIGSPLDRDELVDLVQDVQLHVWRKLGTFAGHAALESWVFRFCHLRLLKHLERRDLRRERTQLASHEILAESASSRATPPDGGRDDEGIEHFLRHVSPREAEVTRLRYVENLEFGEIAETLDISVSSAKTHCYRALEKLRPIFASRAAQLDGEAR